MREKGEGIFGKGEQIEEGQKEGKPSEAKGGGIMEKREEE